MWGFFYFCTTKYFQMKKFYFLLLALGLFTSVNAQAVSFNDSELNLRLLSANPSNTIAKDLNGNYFKIDVNNNGIIEVSEALNVSYLDINSYDVFDPENPIFYQKITDITGLESFQNIVGLNCNGNSFIALDLRPFTNLKNIETRHCNLNNLYLNSNIEYVECFANNITSLNLTGLMNLKNLSCGGNDLISLDLSGNFPNLTNLSCGANQITTLNVSGAPNLKFLSCYSNKLNSLNLSGLINLENLYMSENLFETINFSGLNKLKYLDCGKNQLNTIDLSFLTNLEVLNCNNNLLSNLSINNLKLLSTVYCDNNQLSELNLSNLNKITTLHCDGNQLTTLDVSNLKELVHLRSKSNLLTSLIVKNGANEFTLDFSNNPNLQFICADEDQLESVNNKITQYGYTNCHVNSYCTFRPGGDFYTVSGVNRFDDNLNGCDLQDGLISKVKYKITKGSIEGYFISNSTGGYSIGLQAGTYNVKPEIENGNYFTISPSDLNFSFNQNSTPFTQDFCITPNGSHSDIEVSIIPVEEARPGFDAKYKIIYKNKGNQVENGSISLNFDDAKIDFVSAGNAPTQSTGSLTWNYTNLQPFETRTIDVLFNINSPMETPAVNGGDVLSYTTTITSGNSDEMPNDNTFTLNQTVVNSFDPNDITCLEGAKVSTSKIGDYVHYMIRFENTGSANATNIVVKDVVDAAKYDVNSSVPINGSHDFYTRINGNNVEFIFENINLPFADATNDGYVAFKIKTKSTLVTGDSFSKNANIYFDYNFPIVTNTATTTIAALSNQDFEFKNYFTLYPNPVNDRLTIETKNSIEVSSINIYNTLGQLVLVIPNAQNVKTVDVSSLTSGNYFIKINSDKGTSNAKFIKN
jgi:uncharacterized repeat protein (TIGR01451 family)